MKAIGCFAKGVLGLIALPVGLALLIGIPLGAFALLDFLSREAMTSIAIPAIVLYIFGFCAPLAIYHWSCRGNGRSGGLRLPGWHWLAGVTAVSIGAGQIMLSERQSDIGYWVVFCLAAGLPPLTALSLAVRRLGPVTTWRRALAGLVCGSILSTHAAVLLGAAVTLLGYLVVLPLREVLAGLVPFRDAERLFFSPALLIGIVEIALVAPVVEELTKPLGAILLARRLRGPAEAFLVGMAGGAGFAILENMLYESAGSELWASIAILRAVGGALHPLNAGLVAVGWYGVRNGLPGSRPLLIRLYGLAVGLHALWNGSLVLLYSGIGVRFFGTEGWQLDVYGVGQPVAVLAVMLLEAILIWRILLVASMKLSTPAQSEVTPLPGLGLEQPHRLALWATAVAFAVVPIAALYGPLLDRYLQLAAPIR